MNITISIKYYKGGVDGFRPFYNIAPPENVPELCGYVMRMPADRAKITDKCVVIFQGNEWDPKSREHLFMFEKEEKTPGHPSKRYRYHEAEVFIMYGNASSPTFGERLEKRIRIFSEGSGKLVRATFRQYEHQHHMKRECAGWFLSPDADPKWVYSFDYDPLQNRGKHNRNAVGFSVLEEYAVDMAAVQRHKDRIKELLGELDRIRAEAESDAGQHRSDRLGSIAEELLGLLGPERH